MHNMQWLRDAGLRRLTAKGRWAVAVSCLGWRVCRELPLLICQVLGERLGSPCPLMGSRKKLSVKSLIEIFTQCNGFLGSGIYSYHLVIDIFKSSVESISLTSVERNGCSQADSFKLSWTFILGQVVLGGWPSLCVGCRVGCWGT